MNAYAYFESIEREIIQLLDRAQFSVLICVAWIRPEIFQSVFTRLDSRGVRIELIYNQDHTNSRSKVREMQGAKLHPRAARGQALMHNKFCIIDERIVITGSYNWSGNAAKHYENIVVIEDNFSLVKGYLHEFHDLLELDATQRTEYCSVCNSATINVMVLGDESGLYSESQVALWNICTKNSHVRHLGFTYENFLSAQLGLDDEHEFPEEFSLEDRESLIVCFRQERSRISKLRQYYSWRQVTDAKGRTHQIKLHAVGRVGMANQVEVDKGYSTVEEWVLGIAWRDRWMRRHISTVYEYEEGNISDIIDGQRGIGAIWRAF